MAHVAVLDLKPCQTNLTTDSTLCLEPIGFTRGHRYVRYEVCLRENHTSYMIGRLSPELSTDGDGRVTVTVRFDLASSNKETRRRWTEEVGLAVFRLLVSEFERHGFDTFAIRISRKTCSHLIQPAKRDAGFRFCRHTKYDSTVYWNGQRQLKRRQQRRHERTKIGQFRLRLSDTRTTAFLDKPADGRLKRDIHRVVANASGQQQFEMVVFVATDEAGGKSRERLLTLLCQMFGIVVNPIQWSYGTATVKRTDWEPYLLQRKKHSSST